MANHGGYSDPNAHAPQMEHQYTHTATANTGGYGNAAAPQTGYASNGYSQGSYGNTTMASTGYPSTGAEYDTTHYDYSNTATYDTRYQSGYTQDYSQTYGTTTDYSAVSTDTYASQQYDDRSTAYSGYGKYA
uniref:Uncharacterized protein n=1 Tax=Anopheles maculatus TaxID=74869 RepID=A0A182SMP9_9DIPT